MRLFTVLVEERRIRRHRIAAPDQRAATALARQGLGRHDRILSADETSLDYGEQAADEAMAWLLSRAFLPLPGTEDAASVLCWIERALDGWLDDTNRVLATAGLRVFDDQTLAVGSAATIPTLSWWAQGTIYGGGGLTAALRGGRAARLANLTFAGRRARSVRLPLSGWVAAELIHEAAA